MMRRAMITGLAGLTLSEPERRFLGRTRPLGIILFTRNLNSHTQIKNLIKDARLAIASDDVLVLIDQEGGRVQRLKPPLGRALPPARRYAAHYEDDAMASCEAAYMTARLLAGDLTALGINCNCAPVLDIPLEDAHDIIGDRAYGTNPEQVIALGRAIAQGFIHGSVLPVIKHIPGHGRAGADSHLSLPMVGTPLEELEKTDFAPFKALKDIPAAMTAHILYSDIDPDSPASTSPRLVNDIIRQKIGFSGLLMSDDLSMKALEGPMRERAKKVITAGCDVALHCNGNFDEMECAAEGVPQIKEERDFDRTYERFMAAIEVTKGISAKPFDIKAAECALKSVFTV